MPAYKGSLVLLQEMYEWKVYVHLPLNTSGRDAFRFFCRRRCELLKAGEGLVNGLIHQSVRSVRAQAVSGCSDRENNGHQNYINSTEAAPPRDELPEINIDVRIGVDGPLPYK